MTARAVDADALAKRAVSLVTESAILDATRVLCSRASATGEERALADDVAAWGRRAYPDATWTVDALDASSANLIARSSQGDARELAIYGHLDTSLTGDALRDRGITGTDASSAPFAIDASRTLRGFGVGVAKAPSAAGIAAFMSAVTALRAEKIPHRLTLLLAAGGTHRAAPGPERAAFARGVRHALASGWRPDAVLNVKGGPPGVLREEPAAAYLRVTLRRPWSAALARRSAAPDGGLARHTGAVIDAIEAWRERYLAANPGRGQLAPEIAIGAIASGSAEKPDLIPGILEVYVYAVLLPKTDPDSVARELAGALAPRVATLPGSPKVAVDVYAFADGGSAIPAADIVHIAERAWAGHVRPATEVRGWTGATDGAIFLDRGIPTARMGVNVSRDVDDPRVESVSLDELVAAARAYTETAVRYSLGGRT